MPLTYVTEDFNEKKLQNNEKKLQNTNQTKFRIEKVIEEKA